MRRTRIVAGPVGATTVNLPSASVIAPSVVPTTLTVADATGSLDPSAVTRPVIRRVCAHALVPNSASIMNDMTNERVVLTRLSMVGWSELDTLRLAVGENRYDRANKI